LNYTLKRDGHIKRTPHL